MSLEENEKRIGEVRPMIASVGASPEAVKRIVEGRQTVSIYCDPAALIRECVELADLLLAGKPLPMLPEENTGMGQVLCLPLLAAGLWLILRARNRPERR